MTKPTIMLACDFSHRDQLFQLLDQFPKPIYVKLGMEAIYSMGTEIITPVRERGHRIFLDLKLHDIPNTVACALRNLAKLKVDMLNVHATGGLEMMKAAAQAVKEVNPDTKCIAVTLLTSLNQQNLEELRIQGSVQQTALHYAQQAKAAGLDGVVCSVYEAPEIHQVCGADFLCVTPGIRLPENAHGDQKRVATPQFAKQQGADYIVVGRAISQSATPYQTYLQIKDMLK